MEEDYELINNKENRQYELHVDGYTPKIEYAVKDGKDVYLTYTSVPSELRGRGIGKQLVEKALQDIEKEGMDVVPLCTFVATYMSKNPEWKRLLKKGLTIG